MQYSQVSKKRICLPLTVFVGREKPLTSGLKLILPSNNIVSENKYYHAACPASYFDKRTNHTKQLSQVSSNPLHPATHFLSKKKKMYHTKSVFLLYKQLFFSVPKKKKKREKATLYLLLSLVLILLMHTEQTEITSAHIWLYQDKSQLVLYLFP